RMPELGIFDERTRLIEFESLARFNRVLRSHFKDESAIRIENASPKRALPGVVVVVANFGFHVHRRRVARDMRRGDGNAMPGDVERGSNDQIDVPVQPTTENVLAGAGSEAGVPCVVHTNGEQIFARLNELCNVKTESGVSAIVLPHAMAVDEDLR